MKVLVKTKNLLLTTMMGEVMYPHRASVVGNSAFLQGKIARQDVTVLKELPDDANDADWEKFLKDSDNDHDLALTSYLSKLAGETEDDAAEEAAKLDAEKAAAEKAAAEKAAAEKAEADKAASEAAAEKAAAEAAEKAAAAEAAEAAAKIEAEKAAAAAKADKKGK